MNKPYATAKVTCRDGKARTFTADVDGECFYYQGRKHIYIIWDEPEGRGFITMVPDWNSEGERTYLLAPSKFQPTRIEATTWSGMWKWEVGDE